MERLFLECAIRAALMVCCSAAMISCLRVRSAGPQHSIWTAVLASMLVLPAWTVGGPKAALRLLPPVKQLPEGLKFARNATVSAGVLQTSLFSTWDQVFLTVYFCGLVFLGARLIIGTMHARRLVRNSMLDGGVRTSDSCAAPVTVGLIRPVMIFPVGWRQWNQEKVDAVLAHEVEHLRRRDALVQWFALVNRAVFWFHPAAWWLEGHLSRLAEEACDDAVLARGHDPARYAECLLDMARAVGRSGGRVNATGMAMPGSALPNRIRRILHRGAVSKISRTRIACLTVACVISCSTFTAARLEHARPIPPAPERAGQSATPASAKPATKFVLGGLQIQGHVQDQEAVRARIWNAWKDREFDTVEDLIGGVVETGVRNDFQERGYFRVFVKEPETKLLGESGGKQRVQVGLMIEEGQQYHLGDLSFENVPPDRALSVPNVTLREQFHLHEGDLFRVTEIRAGLQRTIKLYQDRGYAEARPQPETKLDDAAHRIDVLIRITEGKRKP
jgi:BlaR1 peptidase M56/Surface antigen variable number repeat